MKKKIVSFDVYVGRPVGKRGIYVSFILATQFQFVVLHFHTFAIPIRLSFSLSSRSYAWFGITKRK